MQGGGSPGLKRVVAVSWPPAWWRGLSSQVGSGRKWMAAGGGTGGTPPRVPPTPGASAGGGGGKVPPKGPNAAHTAARSAKAASAKSLALVGQRFAGEAYLDIHYGSMSNWMKSMRRPMDIFKFSKNRFAAIAAGDVSAGGIAKMMSRSPGMAAGAGMLAAPLTVGFVGDMIGVNDWFGKGTGEGRWDQAAEGLLAGAAFGAVGGGPAAAISGVAGMLLNVVTNGGLVEGMQNMPLIGGSFGGDKDYINWKADALKFYQGAADAQGQPELAEQAASGFEFYAKLIEAGWVACGVGLERELEGGRGWGVAGPEWSAEEVPPG